MTADRARRDLMTRTDVEALLRRFYGQVLIDDLLTGPFADIRRNGLDSHLPVMTDFWETVLFRTGRYQGSAVRAHQPVHDRHLLTAAHFLRWLKLWNCTIDEMYQGPTAEHARIQAARIARAMHHRLTAKGSRELDDLVRQGMRPHPSDHRRQSDVFTNPGTPDRALASVPESTSNTRSGEVR